MGLQYALQAAVYAEHSSPMQETTQNTEGQLHVLQVLVMIE